MADIRIKDLTTTASSTASDDFIAVDGTTNGTRKLNAFSPTFGGNATVTGNLTVSGTTIRSSNTISVDSGNTSFRYDIYRDGAGTYQLGHLVAYGSQTGFGGFTWANLDFGKLWEISNQGNGVLTGTLKVNSTTASTTTSSGALVVSGGVGVAGNINGGGAILAQGALSSIPAVNYLSTEISSGQGYITCYNGSGSAYLALNYRASQHNFTSNGAVAVQSTTASTSTSSGALVVSGGVGVAGAINCGGDITAPTTANITGGRFTSVNSNSYIEQSGSDFNYVTASTRPHVFSIGGTTRFQVTTSGIISSLPASAASLTVNSTMTFELTSNTSLKIFVRGSDGTTRSTTLTLA